ncbi:putative toxin-antitoxin system toxin component, PIN family [Longimicrobium sp.]|uniref:putative toxin-antitoxin system toxin component, PIN family n=1 Tax=Longimicrobium sp. TaxID=2029185 RepID=UPI002EDA5FD6
MVLDTSVLVSNVLFPQGVPAQVFKAWRAHCYSLFTTPAILQELMTTLAYPRIRLKYRISEAEIQETVDYIRDYASFVPGTADVSDSLLRDPNDRMILSTVLEAKAHVLVASDKDLLVLGQYRGTEIVTPRQFLERFVKLGEQPDAGG